MRQKLFVICDADEQYLESLQSYLEKKKLADFQVMSFSSLELAREYNLRNSFEIMLLNEQLYEENVKDMQIGMLFLLTEDNDSEAEKWCESTFIKYQSAERLLSSILDSYAKDECCKSGMHCKNQQTRVFTFYSPDAYANQTMAALAAGETLSEKRRVLYLNLKPFSGLNSLLGNSESSDLSDFIYFVLKHSDRLVYKLGAMKKSVGGLDYIPSIRNPKDLMQIGEAQWKQILDALLENSDYEDILIEVSEACQGLEGILERSDRIYMIYGESDIALARIAEYQSFLSDSGREDVLQKTSFILEPQEWRQREYNYAELAFVHPGQYMKGILMEDGIM